MLDDYILEQKNICKIIKNSIEYNKYSHAYLIETNGYSKGYNLALSFAKYLLCPKTSSNNSNCADCEQCKNIDDGNFIELKIISPEGQWIKKNQLSELQQDFSKISIMGNKKVYIINSADKLNESSSNSLLKFLEEPQDGIVAILITENKSQLLDTIVSRCQILSLNKDIKNEDLNTINKIAINLYSNSIDITNFLNDENSLNFILHVIEFIKYYEDNKSKTIIYIKKLWHDYFIEKKDIYNAFTIILLFYKDVLNDKIDRKIEVFNDYLNEIKHVSKNNNINQIINKINVIMDLRDKINTNVNNNLLMDKFIIELEGSEDND